jgi:hypothetical protein
MSNKVCLIAARNLSNITPLLKYISAAEDPIDIIYWNRNELNESCEANRVFAYNRKTSEDCSKAEKLLSYLGFRHFVLKILRRNKYDKIILLPTQTAVMLFDFYENTTLMIVGDHLTMSKRFCTGIDRSNRAVYNCIINSAVDTKNTNNREFMILDLFPTTLAALGYTFEGSRLGLGTNLFAQDPTLCELFGTEYFDEQLSLRSTFYERVLIQGK